MNLRHIVLMMALLITNQASAADSNMGPKLEKQAVKKSENKSPIQQKTVSKPKPIKIPIARLLDAGFDIKAMQYLDKSMVFTLQKWKEAFVCETKFSGETIICVKLY